MDDALGHATRKARRLRIQARELEHALRARAQIGNETLVLDPQYLPGQNGFSKAHELQIQAVAMRNVIEAACQLRTGLGEEQLLEAVEAA